MRNPETRGVNCVICGVGGQGNVLASRLLAHVFFERNDHVKTAETIGMAQRGGSVASHVRSGRPNSPLVPKHAADCLIAFEPAEAVRCLDYVRPGGTIVVNTQAIQPPSSALATSGYDGAAELTYLIALENAHVIVVDGARLCAMAGSPKVLNVVLVAEAVKSGVLGISRAELEQAIRALVKPAFIDVNLRAVEFVFAE